MGLVDSDERAPIETPADGASPVTRVLDLLFAVVRSTEPPSASHLSALLGMPRPSVYRHLRSLSDYGLLSRQRDGYRVTPAFVRLTSPGIDAIRFAEFAEPYLAEIAYETSESCGLHVRVGSLRRCINEVEGTQQVRWVLGVGFTSSLTLGAAGIALLSRSPAEELLELEQDSPGLEKGLRPLVDRVDEVRAQGWYLSVGEAVPDACSLAVPLVVSDRVVGAINVAAPASRASQLTQHTDRLLLQAARIADAWMSVNSPAGAVGEQPSSPTPKLVGWPKAVANCKSAAFHASQPCWRATSIR